jgi:16S rRNA (guanine(1405)-N(7))-methyltransferase
VAERVPDSEREALIRALQGAAKYAAVPLATLADIADHALRHERGKAALKTAKAKLHNVIADYLGDPDYAVASQQIGAAAGPEAIRAACVEIAAAHASTRERLAVLNEFYPRLWAVTGTPHTLIDLACGLNPVLIPFMALPADACYYAYDIHPARVTFLNGAIRQLGVGGGAELRDILVSPPEIRADAALILKEVHRFEQRRRGVSRALIDAVRARWVLVSLPTRGMNGRQDLRRSYRNLFYKVMAGSGWPVIEVEFENEMVFCVEKPASPTLPPQGKG